MWGSWKACAHTYFVQTWRECWYTHKLLWIKQLSLSCNNLFKWNYRNTSPLSGLSETLFDKWYQWLYATDGRKRRKTRRKRLCVTCFVALLTFFFFFFLNLCQGCWRLVESFFKQNYSHAFQTTFAVFCPLPSCCVFSLKINHVDSRKQQNAGSGTSRLGN